MALDVETRQADRRLQDYLERTAEVSFAPEDLDYERVIDRLANWKPADGFFLARSTPYVYVAAEMLGAELEMLATYVSTATIVNQEKEGGAASVSLEILESMYRAAVSRQALGELRAQHEGGEAGLDETTYYRALRDAVIEAQPVDQTEVGALAGARAETIRAFLVEGQGVDAARVRIIDPVAAEEPSKDDWVRCRLDVDTGA